MKYRAIIHDAWVLTQENKPLIWWFAFVPALITSLVSMLYLGYQATAFWTSPEFRKNAQGSEEVFGLLFEKAQAIATGNPGLMVFAIVIIALVGLAYLMLPVFTQGALIQLIARKRAGQPISVMEGISFGFNRFLQLFEYHLAVKTFSLIGVLTEAAFVLRNLGLEAFAVFGWIFALILVVGLFLSLLFTYSEYYIVIDKTGVFKGMLSSSGLVVRQWHHTLFMLLLMVLISFRIVINILVALIIPVLVIAPIFLFASLTLVKLGVVFGIIVGLIALYFASYFLGVFHVFSTAVWTFTFIELTMRKQEDENLRGQLESAIQEADYQEPGQTL